MKSEHTLGIQPRRLIVEKMQIFLLSLELLQCDIDGRIRLFFFSPLFERCESHDTPCGKRFLCQHQGGREITQQFRPSGGTYQTWHCVELQKQIAKSSLSPFFFLSRYTATTTTTTKRNPANPPQNSSAFSYYRCLGEKAQITSPTF